MEAVGRALEAGGEERVCLFDLPPMLSKDNSIASLRSPYCILLGVAEGSTRKTLLVRALRLLIGTSALGLELNQPDVGSRAI